MISQGHEGNEWDVVTGWVGSVSGGGVEPTVDGVVRKIVPEKMPPELRPQGRDEQRSQVIP